MPKSFQKTFFILLIFTLFLPENFLVAENQTIIINEIAWMGTVNSSYDEWVELRNLSDQEINLEGWTLIAEDGTPEINLSGTISPRGYFLLERTDDSSVPDVEMDLDYVGALEDGGEILYLKDANGIEIDSVDGSNKWNDLGDNSTKQTMERTEDFSWQTSENVGGTPKAKNTSSQPSPPEEDSGYCGDGNLDDDEECDDGNTENGDSCDSECKIEEAGAVDNDNDNENSSDNLAQNDEEPENEVNDNGSNVVQQYKSGDIVINEFVSDPSDEDVEWVELYNTLYDKDIDLNDWYIEEGSGAKTYLEGMIKRSGVEKYFVIEKPKGNLNNKGDAIKLYSGDGILIDQVYYGDWDSRSGNAPVAKDPNSVARKWDGQNTYNDNNDFVITTTPTKGSSNIIVLKESEQEVDSNERVNYDYSDDIIISEIFPNPEGIDSEKEFIEIFNQGDISINLRGWKFGDNSKRKYEIKGDLFIKAKEYLVINREDSKIALNNTSDEVKLFRPLEDKVFQVVEYKDVVEDWSYSFDGEDYVWTEVVTPGEENIIKEVNHPPVVDFYFPDEILVNTSVLFDSSDTFDIDEDELSFEWDFGDGIKLTLENPEHGYASVGNYIIKLKVSDGENEVIKEKKISVIQLHPSTPLAPLERGIDISSPFKGELEGVVINEILPNPKGSDADGEFVELKNLSQEKINLLNWKVDDIDGGSKPYQFSSDQWIDPNSFYVLERIESGLALNNTNEQVRLFDNYDELIETLEYEKSVEGQSFSRGQDGEFYWTSKITPGEENIISVSNSLAYSSPQIAGVKITHKKDEKEYQKIDLENISEYESGDLIITQGIVAVKPGVFGTQYFYIIGSPTSTSTTPKDGQAVQAGLQIYNYHKDFPSLEIGDYTEVIGELSEVNGEQRLKTKTKDDIVVLERDKEINVQELKCDQVSDEYLGQLISVTGEVVEQKSSIVYIDDGTEEIRVYVKKNTGISSKYFKEGEVVSVVGILGKTTSGLRLMPRSLGDIIKKDVESNESYPEVLGEKIENTEWVLAQRDKKLELFKYLLVIAGGVIILLAGLLVREIRK